MSDPRSAIVHWSTWMADRGLVHGATGNVSVRVEDLVYVTPTGSSLAALDPAALSVIALDGRHLSGDTPTKEAPLHLAFHRRASTSTSAVVHTHSGASAAASCVTPWSRHGALPPVTPYLVMTVGQTPLIPYARPGNTSQGALIEALPAGIFSALLANHGPVTTAPTLALAVERLVELEESARLVATIGERTLRPLGEAEVAELTSAYGTRWIF